MDGVHPIRVGVGVHIPESEPCMFAFTKVHGLGT